MTVSIVYETHSTTTDNEEGFATGWNEGRLSDKGREQARELGDRRRDDRIALVYVSDLGRAVETVEIAFSGASLPVSKDWRLRECNYGELNGMPVERFVEERPRRIDVPYPGGESYIDVVERMRTLLDDIRRKHDGRRVLLIGHAAPKWALDNLLRGIPLEDQVHGAFNWQPGWEYTA